MRVKIAHFPRRERQKKVDNYLLTIRTRIVHKEKGGNSNNNNNPIIMRNFQPIFWQIFLNTSRCRKEPANQNSQRGICEGGGGGAGVGGLDGRGGRELGFLWALKQKCFNGFINTSTIDFSTCFVICFSLRSVISVCLCVCLCQIDRQRERARERERERQTEKDRESILIQRVYASFMGIYIMLKETYLL